MPEFWMWQGSEYAKVTQGFKYANVWIGREYVWIYNNRQGSEYVSYNTQREVTLQVNEYLLSNRPIQNLVKNLRWSALKE